MSEKGNLYFAADALNMPLKFNESSGAVSGSCKFKPPGFDFVYGLEVEHRFNFSGPIDDVILVVSAGMQTPPRSHLVMILDIRDKDDALLTLVSKGKLPPEFRTWGELKDEDELTATIAKATLGQYKLNKTLDGWDEVN